MSRDPVADAVQRVKDTEAARVAAAKEAGDEGAGEERTPTILAALVGTLRGLTADEIKTVVAGLKQ